MGFPPCHSNRQRGTLWRADPRRGTHPFFVAFGLGRQASPQPAPAPTGQWQGGTQPRHLKPLVYGCPDIQTLQATLDDACDLQRNHYPVKKLGNAARNAVFPSLNEIARPFDETLFDEKKAYAQLEKALYPRKVAANGSICIYGKVFQIGHKYRGQLVYLKFQGQGYKVARLQGYKVTRFVVRHKVL